MYPEEVYIIQHHMKAILGPAVWKFPRAVWLTCRIKVHNPLALEHQSIGLQFGQSVVRCAVLVGDSITARNVITHLIIVVDVTAATVHPEILVTDGRLKICTINLLA